MLLGNSRVMKSSSSGVAARWISACTPSTARRTSAAELMSPTMPSCSPGVGTMSKPRTFCPRASSSPTTAWPIRPAEPVTRIAVCVSMIDGPCVAVLLRSVYRSVGASASSWKGAAAMRLGLLADIHEATVPLQEAIDLFQQARVDEIVVLGDICRMHHQLESTVELLRRA